MPKNVRALFFDLDGTLIDSTEEISRSINELRNFYGLKELEKKEIISKVGKGSNYLLSNTLPEYPAEETFPIFSEIYRENSEKYSLLYEGVKELMTELAEYKKALITNKPGVVTDVVLQKHQLRDYFQLIFSGDSFPLKKPDPFPLNQAAELLEVEQKEIIYLGDGIDDYQACRAAKIDFVLADYGYGVGIEKIGFDFFAKINKPIELLELLK